ncbi:MAG: hypothetical protein KatS3mg011_0292 [Acidimicrobiia bacterium]|nr:MAG: hypothetical protein KatS3mg011_0292 [Acidimicrobiia bacterium]
MVDDDAAGAAPSARKRISPAHHHPDDPVAPGRGDLLTPIRHAVGQVDLHHLGAVGQASQVLVEGEESTPIRPDRFEDAVASHHRGIGRRDDVRRAAVDQDLHLGAHRLVIGILRSRPKALVVILTPGGAWRRLYSLRSTIAITLRTRSRSNPSPTISSALISRSM